MFNTVVILMTLVQVTLCRHPSNMDDVLTNNEEGILVEAAEIILPASADGKIESSPTSEPEHQQLHQPGVNYSQEASGGSLPPPVVSDQQQLPQERAFGTVSIGWILGLGLLAFAFVNTILLGATLFFTFGLFQWLLGIIQVIAPPIALAVTQAFTGFVAPLAAAAPALAG